MKITDNNAVNKATVATIKEAVAASAETTKILIMSLVKADDDTNNNTKITEQALSTTARPKVTLSSILKRSKNGKK